MNQWDPSCVGMMFNEIRPYSSQYSYSSHFSLAHALLLPSCTRMLWSHEADTNRACHDIQNTRTETNHMTSCDRAYLWCQSWYPHHTLSSCRPYRWQGRWLCTRYRQEDRATTCRGHIYRWQASHSSSVRLYICFLTHKKS
jgi:hypothetical protein